MVHLIKSEILLEPRGIQFGTAGGIMNIPYDSVVWMYIRKKRGSREYKFYNLVDITFDITGDLVIIDSNKDTYIFLENCLQDAAGRLLISILEHENTCFVGYDLFCEKIYQEDFAEMIRACKVMQEAYR